MAHQAPKASFTVQFEIEGDSIDDALGWCYRMLPAEIADRCDVYGPIIERGAELLAQPCPLPWVEAEAVLSFNGLIG